ncbi:MAG: metallophosphoesterase [Candidatus Obscuribacterales bacterium]|jgi:acid phosphatase type 7|nr:metallophosphoesterase [Candidatus Obscuribacterales bacterium]
MEKDRARLLSLALLVPLLMLCGCADVSRLNIDFASKEARNAQLQKELDKSVGDFVVAPYLQLGYGTDTRCSDSLDLLWFTRRAQAGEYKILVKTSKDADYRVCEPIRRREIKMPGTAEAFYKFAGTMTGLVPGESFDYRLVTMPGNKIVFAASGIARKAADQKARIAIFGDCGANTPGQRKVALQCDRAKPDFVIIPGDVVYRWGLISEYLTKFFPIYNAKGLQSVELLRRIPFVAALGNHDIAKSDTGINIDRYPDALGFFLFIDQPLNGFAVDQPGTNTYKGLDGKTYTRDFSNKPFMLGEPSKVDLVQRALGDAFPKMSNFSFDYANAHFTVLDGNEYMLWNTPALKRWLEADLDRSRADKSIVWRFVVMHQPAFTIDAPHAIEDQTRLILDVVQAKGVDMIFAGHSHCYERTRPIVFNPLKGQKAFAMSWDKKVTGRFDIDNDYDGIKKTRSRGIIHIVTGGGGAPLYPKGAYFPDKSSDYMLRYDSSKHSFTSLDLDGTRATITQIDEDGKTMDRFVVSK